MKRHRGIANEYLNKNYDSKIKRENQHLLSNINEIVAGNYSSKVPKRAITLASHKFKSLRADEMRNMNDKIRTENKYYRNKIHSTTSLLNKEKLMQASEKSLRHSEHLSRYGRNMRHFDTLPKIFQKSTMANASSMGEEFNSS